MGDAGRFLVFVPGMMGSILKYKGPDSYGLYTERIVWGEDVTTNLSAFTAEPEILLGSRLYPAGVIRQLKAFKIVFDIYGRLVDFLGRLAPVGLGYTTANLLVFSYDWRASNKLTAQALARELRERSGSNSIGILAHSMGGIIARLMVADPENQDIVSRIFRIVQVASPILGSAKAYYTLRERPCISAAFDWIWLWHHRLFPGATCRANGSSSAV